MAGDLTVSVRDSAGRPVRDAVITVSTQRRRAGRTDPLCLAPADRPAEHPVPALCADRAGRRERSAFPNLDRVRHQRLFVLARQPVRNRAVRPRRDPQPRLHHGRRRRAGLQHPRPDAGLSSRWSIRPWAAKTDATGDVVIRAIPAGGARLMVWHPRLNVRGNESAYTSDHRRRRRAPDSDRRLLRPRGRPMIAIRFKTLQTRLTVLYMGLFGIALMLVAVGVVTAITGSARGLVRDELGATGRRSMVRSGNHRRRSFVRVPPCWRRTTGSARRSPPTTSPPCVRHSTTCAPARRSTER